MILNPIRVCWTTHDTRRAQDEATRALEAARAKYAGDRAAQFLFRDFEDWFASQPRLEPSSYATKHTGLMIAVAYQPESYAVAKSDKGGTTERHVKARWAALVIRDADAKLVELDPTTFDKSDQAP